MKKITLSLCALLLVCSVAGAQKWKIAEDQMKGLQGKSTEELLQMLKNK